VYHAICLFTPIAFAGYSFYTVVNMPNLLFPHYPFPHYHVSHFHVSHFICWKMFQIHDGSVNEICSTMNMMTIDDILIVL